MTSHVTGWSFRTRLATLIAVVFVAGGAVLLGVQYLLVQQLFSQSISTMTGDCTTDVQGGSAGTTDDALTPTCVFRVDHSGEVTVADAGSGGVSEVSLDGFVIQQSTQISQEVLSGLVLWSVVVLVVFAGLAVLAAWWLSKRSLGRIARITETTREITRDDLHQRLDLPGPDDEIKELGDTIDGMLDRLNDAFERQDRFITGASHELRTPLTTTRTLLEIPLTQGRVPAELEPAVRGALDANDRSERLIAALLTLARITQAPTPTEAAPVDLSALARTALDERESEAASHALTVEAPEAPILTTADETLARIAVGNLIENAIRHNHDHGTVRVAAYLAGDTARLVIENDGRKFTAAEVARLIEPFHRGEQTRLAGPGTGLGLTLADTIARTLGGTLDLTPRTGGGITAILILPAGDRPMTARV